MKKLEIDIKCCDDCPFSVYREDYDVGVSFGMDYYCAKGAKRVRNPANHSVEKMRGTVQERPMTKEETRAQIRSDCPLPNTKEA